MKRLTPKMRERLRRIARWSLEKRLARRGYGQLYGDSVRLAQFRVQQRRTRSWAFDDRVIVLKGPLELVRDPKGVFRQLAPLDEAIDSHAQTGGLRVIMDDVTSFDPAGLLYMCSRIGALSSLGVNVAGTWPKSAEAVKRLVDGGFTGFLHGQRPRFDSSTRTLQLYQGSARQRVDPQLAADVRTFLGNLNPALGTQEIDHINLAVMEWVENVRQHAYPKKPRSEQRPWYLVGFHDVHSHTSTVAILDRGVGMRRTVESQLNRLQKAFQWATQPTHDLIKEATMGLRTETGERHRGWGLRKLRDFVIESRGRRLHVLSADGMVSWNQAGSEQRTIPRLDGTLVTLEIETPAGAL